MNFFLNSQECSGWHCEVLTLEVSVYSAGACCLWFSPVWQYHSLRSQVMGQNLPESLRSYWILVIRVFFPDFLPDDVSGTTWLLVPVPYMHNVANSTHVMLLQGFKYINCRVYNSFETFVLTLCCVSCTFLTCTFSILDSGYSNTTSNFSRPKSTSYTTKEKLLSKALLS